MANHHNNILFRYSNFPQTVLTVSGADRWCGNDVGDPLYRHTCWKRQVNNWWMLKQIFKRSKSGRVITPRKIICCILLHLPRGRHRPVRESWQWVSCGMTNHISVHLISLYLFRRSRAQPMKVKVTSSFVILRYYVLLLYLKMLNVLKFTSKTLGKQNIKIAGKPCIGMPNINL